MILWKQSIFNFPSKQNFGSGPSMNHILLCVARRRACLSSIFHLMVVMMFILVRLDEPTKPQQHQQQHNIQSKRFHTIIEPDWLAIWSICICLQIHIDLIIVRSLRNHTQNPLPPLPMMNRTSSTVFTHKNHFVSLPWFGFSSLSINETQTFVRLPVRHPFQPIYIVRND